MHLVALLQATENRDRVRDGRLPDEHGLEPPLQGRVLFDVLAIFVERRGADHVQLAARQRRLEEIRRVHRAFGGPRPHQRVQLVDEHDELPLGRRDLLDHGLQALLEFAAILGAGDQLAQIERYEMLVVERFRHVAVDDALGEAFGDRRFAHTRLADQHRVVLGPARQHLHDTPDFFVAADHGIELALARLLGQVAGVALQRLILLLGLLVGHLLAAAHRLQRLHQLLLVHAGRCQELARRGPLLLGQGDEDMLGRDVGVSQLLRFAVGAVQHAGQLARHRGLRRRA